MSNFEEEKLNRGAREIREIRMTAEEKERVLKNILSSSPMSPLPVRSPYADYFHTLLSGFSKKHFAYVAVFCLAVVLGGGAVFASQGSLPGNILYSLKVGVIEPVHSVFIFSPETRARYQSNLATLRLIEAEALKSENRLDIIKEKKLAALLEKHVENFSKIMENHGREESVSENASDDIVINFQAEMNAHARVLDFIGQGEERIESEPTANIKISKTARDSATKVRDAFKNNMEQREAEETPHKYENRKNAVQSIIDSTAIDINRVSADSSPVKQKIIEDTNETLNQAREFLREVDEENEEEDFHDAYLKLLDSESSAREAGIFLETGLKWREKNNKEE